MLASARSLLAATAFSSLFAASCGSDPRPPVEVPSAAQSRDFLGFGAGSCWRYRFRPAGAQLDTYATVTLIGPDTQRISGRTIYIWSYQKETGGLPLEWLLDFDSEASKVILRRFDEGRGPDGVTTYDEGAPVWMEFKFDTSKKVDFAKDIFESGAVPRGGSMTIEHTWVVLNRMAMAATPSGVVPAISMSYERTGADEASFSLVQSYGFASFTDSENILHQVCASRTCDSANNCTGADSCANLVCP